jgi:hypothetical protein
VAGAIGKIQENLFLKISHSIHQHKSRINNKKEEEVQQERRSVVKKLRKVSYQV